MANDKFTSSTDTRAGSEEPAVKSGKAQPSRDARGHFEPGHRLGGRGSRHGSITAAFNEAGVSITEARRIVIEATVRDAKLGKAWALSRLAAWTMPEQRVVANIFRGASTASERAQRVLDGLDAGDLTPMEAAQIAKGALEHAAEASEWSEVRRLLAEAEARQQHQLPASTVEVVEVPATEVGPASDHEDHK